MKIEYCFGIYYYVDKETGNIVYIGKDSHIDKHLRKNNHLNPSRYNSQPFNRVLQNNPDRYEYKVYCHVSSIDELNQLEFDLINLYRPKFNYKHGGDGGIAFEKRNADNFTYTVVKGGKASDYNKKQQYCICDRYNKHLIQSIDYDFLVTVADRLNSGEITEDNIPKRPFKYTVAKVGIKKGKQIYCIMGKSNVAIVSSIYHDKLAVVADALNEGIILEDDVKSAWGIGAVMELIYYANNTQTRLEEYVGKS